MTFFTFIYIILAGFTVAHGLSTKEAIKEISSMAQRGDDLGIRVLARSIYSSDLNGEDFVRVRDILHGRPTVGFDLLFAWDNHKSRTEKKTKIDTMLNEADHLMLKHEFLPAFRLYQKIAIKIKGGDDFSKHRNDYLLLSVIHRMARALFGAKKYEEALRVSQWITPKYAHFRQVLFERMWITFRAKKYKLALGANASQKSSYFPTYLSPESYLVQIYINKIMCRSSANRTVINEIRKFLVEIENGKYEFPQWAQGDVEIYSLYRLYSQTQWPISEVVTKQQKDLEQKKIKMALEKRFASDKERLKKALQSVLSFSVLSVDVKATQLAASSKMAPADSFSKNGYEFWPVSKSEDWLDELGQHVAIGGTQCER
mgnify:CR=1 FL=1